MFFLTHASWSLQGTPDVRRYGPRWLTYVYSSMLDIGGK